VSVIYKEELSMLFVRILYLVWFIGMAGFVIAAIADLLFGSTPFADRVNNLAPRIVVAIVWPLAAMTPRGRYLLWAKWQLDRHP
jgi:hypothetical protein